MGTDRRATQSSEKNTIRGPRTHPVCSRWLRWSRAHGSTIPVWRPTPSDTNFPPRQTQRDPDVCESIEPPSTARRCHPCLHTVEAEPNSGFLRSLVHGPHPARTLAPAARTLFHQSLRDPHSELVPEAHAATLTYTLTFP